MLPRIRATRDDRREDENAGVDWAKLDPDLLPPCARERGSFMSANDVVVPAAHPYAKSSPAHEHLKLTPMRIPAFSAGCVPFRWMLREEALALSEGRGIEFDDELESRAREIMGFDSEWVQDGLNQGAMLDAFFGEVEVERSLCFFYAKSVPLSEDSGRALVGVGRVTHIGNQLPYRNSEAGPFTTLLWERMVQHSVRSGFEDGFLLPYHEALDAAAKDPSVEPAELVAFAPDEAWEEFSFGSEHVSNDSAIGSLIACRQALEKCESAIPGSRGSELSWINDRLAELWRMRGPAPGLGSALSAFGVERGTIVANQLADQIEEGGDPWPAVDRLFEDPGSIYAGLDKSIGPNLRQKWKALPEQRRALLQLLSRFEISPAQAERYYQPTERAKVGIEVSDEALIADPYLLYTLDRVSSEPIAVSTVDRGAFPDPIVREKHPLPTPSRMEDALDQRRVRGLLTAMLEGASKRGDTLQTVPQLIDDLRALPLDPPCPLDADQIAVQDYSPDLVEAKTDDGTEAYQLDRLRDAGELIRRSVEKRIGGNPHLVEADWKAMLADELPAVSDEGEEKARAEKAAALGVLARNRVSVLVGAAGTGKTTLLKVLCAAADLRNGGILLLAPTGKARVQLSRRIGAEARTVAQFLLSIGRYDPEADQCKLSGEEVEDGYATVIVDESSMLTEEQLAAVIAGLRGVKRLILVGDPRQLPPIGSGRPFLDIVNRLEPEAIESRFPRCEEAYAELTVPRRPASTAGQVSSYDAGGRADLLLAEWFAGKGTSAGADEIWDRIRPLEGEWLREVDETLRVGSWTDAKDVRSKLAQLLSEDLDLDGEDAELNFARSLGASEYNGAAYFWREKGEDKPGAGRKAEDWQVLTPVRGQDHGVRELNRFIQHRYRARALELAKAPGWHHKTPKPMGPEEIIYGDKVINVENQRHWDVYPKDDALQYVANGEIGVAVGQWKHKGMKGRPKKLNVEFSSQVGFEYKFGKWAFSDEGSPLLELAYAITVHKSQGSEFAKTYLVIPDPCPVLSRELLYTALTRQRQGVTLLYQGDIGALKAFAGPERGETATRLTNLFAPPRPVQVGEKFLEEGLIHRTQAGDLVRSKSEVIIADLLHSKNIEYAYERRFDGADGSWRYPDFTIEDEETGETIYWEHLGMLGDAEYRKRWERKLEWYRGQKILQREEPGDRVATLLVTEDDPQGGIDSAAISATVKQLLGV